MDAVALASVITSGAVGIGSLIYTAANSKAERAARSDEAAAAREHERNIAQRERVFERQAATYVELLVYAGRMSTRIEETHPLITYGVVGGEPEQDAADTPTAQERRDADESLRDLEARVSAYGSTEVVELADTYIRQMRTFFLDVGTFEILRNQSAPPTQVTQARERLDETRELSRATYEELRIQIRTELGAP